MVDLALEVGVAEGGVSLATAPKRVAGAVQLVRHLERFLDLRAGVGEGVEVRARRRPVHVPAVRKEIRGAPEQLDPGPLLLLLEHLDNGVEVGVALLERLALGGNVSVVERIERDAQFLHEFERGPALASARSQHSVPSSQGRTAVPTPNGSESGFTKVCQYATENRSARASFVADHLVRVVMLELERISRLGSAVLDLGYQERTRSWRDRSDSRTPCLEWF